MGRGANAPAWRLPMTQILFGEYAPDIASVGTATKSAIIKNVVPRAIDGYGPLFGVRPFTGRLPAQPLGFFGAVQSDSSFAAFSGTADKLYRLNPSALTWSDVSGPATINVQTKELWDFAQFGNIVIAVAAGNDPQAFTLGVSTAFANLGGSPPAARRIAVVGDFVVMFGTSANSNRVHWSGINNPTQWTPGVSQSDFQDFPDGGYVQGGAGGEIGLIFQDRAIRRMIYVGPPLIFQFQRISDDRGVLMRYSICSAGGLTFFLSNDGFYKIDRSGVMTPIGADRVDRSIMADADLSDQRYMIGVADPLSKRVFWHYKPRASQNPQILSKCIIYDWVQDRWSPAEFDIAAAAAMIPPTTTLENLDAVSTSIDALTKSLDIYTSTYATSLAGMTPFGEIGFMDGPSLGATLETPEGEAGEGMRTFTRSVAPVGDCPTALVSIRSRDRLIDAFRQSVETPIGVRGYASLRANGRFNSVRVRTNPGAAWSFMRGVDVSAKASGWR